LYEVKPSAICVTSACILLYSFALALAVTRANSRGCSNRAWSPRSSGIFGIYWIWQLSTLYLSLICTH